MHHYLKAKFGKATSITLEGKFKDVDTVTTLTVPNSELVVMQFTGLHDKTGKEIYEGDILEFEEPLFGSGIIRRPVIYEDGGFHAGEHPFTRYTIDSEGEVIGNVHENPDLLKEAA